jgi:hypothetical protein
MFRFFLVSLFLISCGAEVIPLGRQDVDIIRTTCLGGVNQNPETQTAEECDSALNVWAPNGRVESRPGYRGVLQLVAGGTGTATVFQGRAEDVSAGTYRSPSGAGLLSLLDNAGTAGLVGRITDGGDQDRWYLGHSSTFSNAEIVVSATNSNSTRFKAEYWNGTHWQYLHMEEWSSTTIKHLSASVSTFLFVAPADWALTTIDSQSAYWIRFNLLEADLDSSTQVDLDNASTVIYSGQTLVGYFAPRFPTQKRYISVIRNSTNTQVNYVNAVAGVSLGFGSQTTNTGIDEPATIAVVPQFEEAFIAYNHLVTRHVANPPNSETITASVETEDFAVGPGAPHDETIFANLGEFPRAKYINFFRGHLWVANLKDEPYTVRWSAFAPYHKVWPVFSYEILAEHDNSPITGMAPLGEYMVIFKQDSIWMAYDTGFDGLEDQTYAIRQVVNGIGCVSNSSIKAVRGNLIFLAEDGVYSFDGAGVKKLSDNVNTTINEITPGRRPFAAAAHWRKENLYLLSFTTDGSNENDTTLVYDYDAGVWWIWDNIDAQHWLEDEGAADEEKLFFGDSQGRIFEFGVGQTDNGGTITATLTTSRLGFGSAGQVRCRNVWAMCSNKTRSVTVEVLENDATSGSSGTLTFTDSAEADWTDFTFSTDSYVAPRRRLKRIDQKRDGDFFQVKITHNQKYQKFQMSYLDIGIITIGRSRG